MLKYPAHLKLRGQLQLRRLSKHTKQCWGETGRYPLIYQSIRQTLNYYKHLLKAPKHSLVNAALKEQNLLKFPWFKNIEPLLKLDEIFHLDHVSAHRILKNQSNTTPKMN